MQSTAICPEHNEEYIYICMPRGRVLDQKFMCEACKTANINRLSRHEIVPLGEVKAKLVESWGDGHQRIDPLIAQINVFYDTIRQQLLKQLEDDRQRTLQLMDRLKAFHLPFELDAENFNSLLHNRLDRVNPAEVLKMMEFPRGRKNEAAVKKENQLINTLRLQISKLHDRVLSLKYILLAKKIQTDFIIPQLEGESKVGGINEFSRIGGLFNSREKMIRTMRLAYRASEGQYTPQAFMKSCRSLRNCLVVVKCDNNKIVGGYSPLPLVVENPQNPEGEDKLRTSFLFSVSSIKSYSIKENKALEYVKGQIGPCFGPDLKVDTEVTSVLGNFYELPETVKADSLESKVALLQAEKTKLTDFEVWQLAF